MSIYFKNTESSRIGKLSFKVDYGINAAIIFPHPNFPPGVTSGTFGPFVYTLPSAQEMDLLAGKWYSNIHTPAFPGGKIRALRDIKVAIQEWKADHHRV